MTEHELKSRITPDMIRWMCELAEGFEYVDAGGRGEHIYFNSYGLCLVDSLTRDKYVDDFSLLLHRAAEGWNKNRPEAEIIIGNCICYQPSDLSKDPKGYYFNNYAPSTLTAGECALLDCLLTIYEEVVK